jgi:hypothetical protein
MDRENGYPDLFKAELDDDDRVHITRIFFEQIIEKLNRLDARIGMINCDFAGKEYGNWNIRFRSKGRGYEIVEFEYDADARSLSLDL